MGAYVGGAAWGRPRMRVPHFRGLWRRGMEACGPSSAPPLSSTPQITAPRLLDVLAAELPGELGQLCAVFAAFATFGAARGGAPAAAELDGVSMSGHVTCAPASAVPRLLITPHHTTHLLTIRPCLLETLPAAL